MSNERRTPFEFQSILLKPSAEGYLPIEMKLLVTDLDVYEHIDKPYLTGIMAFQDTANIMNGSNIRSGDMVTIKIRDTKGKIFVDKVFRIDKIMSATRMEQNQNSESVVLHIVENHWYESNLRNVNKSYSGKPSRILTTISSDHLDNKTIESSNTDIQSLKVIVPNLTPIEAMCWLKNRTTTAKGYPFYLFSSVRNDKLHFRDLSDMITKEPWNSSSPHSYAASNQGLGDVAMRRTIKSYEHKNTGNLLTLIDKGLVGGNHQYLNPTSNKMEVVKFDIHKDVIKLLETDNISKKRAFYSEDLKVGDKPFNKMTSRVTTQVTSTSSISDKGKTSYSEANSSAEYKRDVISRTVLGLMQLSPMTVTVNGLDFANRLDNTIGSVMRIAFLLTNFTQSTKETFDGKKSGDYLVYSAKHSFKTEGYDVSLTCMKLSNGGFEEKRNDPQ
mgnify:FL=1